MAGKLASPLVGVAGWLARLSANQLASLPAGWFSCWPVRWLDSWPAWPAYQLGWLAGPRTRRLVVKLVGRQASWLDWPCRLAEVMMLLVA